MANLLPQNVKRKYRKEFLLRTIIGWLTITASALAVAIVLLVPTYVSLQAKQQVLLVDQDILQEEIQEEDEDIVASIRAYLDLLKQDTSSRKVPYGIFRHLFELKDDTITYTRIAFAGSENIVTVSGVAATRQDFFDYYSIFEVDPVFDLIGDYPFESLGQAERIPFTFQLTLEEEKK
jgi:hypothetical protein